MGVTLEADDWMIGDNFTDLEAGRRASIRRCFCRFGFGEPRGEPYELAIGRMPDFLTASSNCCPGDPTSPPNSSRSRAWRR